MLKVQEEAFWQTIDILNKLGVLSNIMIIGSWAEYLYPQLFSTDFYPNIRTRDVDFFYRNISLPREKIPLVQKLNEKGQTVKSTNCLCRSLRFMLSRKY